VNKQNSKILFVGPWRSAQTFKRF